MEIQNEFQAMIDACPMIGLPQRVCIFTLYTVWFQWDVPGSMNRSIYCCVKMMRRLFHGKSFLKDDRLGTFLPVLAQFLFEIFIIPDTEPGERDLLYPAHIHTVIVAVKMDDPSRFAPQV